MTAFRMDDYRSEAREARLLPVQARALAKTLELAERRFPALAAEPASGGPGDSLRSFLLPYAAFGMDSAQMLGLLEMLPAGSPLSHREMYYDFRLGRWQKHVEPPTLEECLEEYLASAPSREEGLDYLDKAFRAFRARHAAGGRR